MTQTSLPTGNSTSTSFRLCSRAPTTRNDPSVLDAALGDRDPARYPRGTRPSTERRFRIDVRGEPLGDDLAPVLARAGPHVDEPVRGAHHLLVVLDHEHGVAEVAEPFQRPDQPAVVTLMEPDRGLVEDVEHAHELRADLRREPQPLRLAARERPRCTVEVEVPDPDVVEERQPLADLLEDPPADQHLRRRQLELVDEPQRGGHGLLRELVDRLVANRDGEHLGLEPRSMTDGARPHRHVLLDPLALLARVGLAVAPLQVRDEPLERHRVLPLAAHAVAVRDENPVAAGAVEEAILRLAVELAPRRLQVDLVAIGDRLDDRLVEALAAERPRDERASSSERLGSGTTRSGSISSCEPSPVQRGHAPCGALKEKIRGSSSGSDTPCSGHAFSLNR